MLNSRRAQPLDTLCVSTFLNGIYNNIMLDEKLILVVNLSKLVAVNEYLRERGDELVCIVLDSIVDSLQVALSNSKQK